MSAMRPACKSCHERRQRMRRVFLWLPTKVYDLHWTMYQRGFGWLRFAMRDTDGKHYIEDAGGGAK